MTLEEILEAAVRENASDIFLKSGVPPMFRIAGNVMPMYSDPVQDAEIALWFEQISDERARLQVAEEGEADLAYDGGKIGRFRVNVFKQRSRLSMVIRVIPARIPRLEELRVPAEIFKRLATLPRGFVLVTGIAGAGKSTSIAGMVEYLNENFSKHIVTIEDPIEYVYQDKKCMINQREVGHDTREFVGALKYVVRQSPDVIVIGEMRDRETMEAGLKAAETGHLVFSTMHTQNPSQTVERILSFFEPHEHPMIRLLLSRLLQGVVSQRLMPTKDMSTRVPAVEVMIATPTVRELLMEGKIGGIHQAIKDGRYFGCQTFNQSLKSLLDEDLITIEDAINNSDNPEELRLELRGITKDTSRFQK